MANNGFDEWGGYMEAKITKLEEQFSAASDPFRQSNLFNGISIFVNGLTNPSSDELKRIMMVHGGTYHHYQRSHTTFIVASNLPDVKVRNMDTSKIISPQWIVDCLKEKRILDYTKYLLYTNQKTSQPSISFAVKKKKEEPDISIVDPGGRQVSSTTTTEAVDDSLEASTSANSSGVARTAVDPKFLSEFFNNSRLHHIATLGAGFKQYISDLRDQKTDTEFPARMQLKHKLMKNNVPEIEIFKEGSPKSYIMHIDMDCFFVSVGLRNNPHLRGQPVAVTHSKGGSAAAEVPVHPNADRKVEMELFAKRFEQQLHNNVLSDKVRGGFENKMSLSEIASASYEARAKGIHNGMFVGQALKLCPELKTLPYDFEGYREVAFTLYNTIAQYTLNIEAVSCDEMFVDLTDVLSELKVDVMDFVNAIRDEIKTKTQCPCSAGVGANKLQARMATKKAKPDGQFFLQSENVESYMAEIPIKELPGVGSSTTYTLKDANLVTCGDLQKVSLVRIQVLVGKKFGETLYQFCRGQDQRGLTYGQIRKSVSAEVNYGIRFKTYDELETFLKQLCEEVHQRLLNIKRKTKCITLKLMVRAKEAPVETSKFMGHGVCDHITKSVSLSEYCDDLNIITRNILNTMKALDLPPHELRGIGIQLSKLDEPNSEPEKPKENRIMNMFSKVKEKQKDKPKEVATSNETIRIIQEVPKVVASTNETSSVEANKPKENAIKAMFSKVKEKPKVERKEPPTNPIEVKKSPENKRPTTSRRGRGKTTVSTKDVKTKQTKQSVMGLLQNAAAKRKQDDTEFQMPSDIDLEVFNALPPDIQNEILSERRRQKHVIVEPPPPPPAKKEKPQTNSNNISMLNESDFLPSTSRAAQQKQERKIAMKNQKKLNTETTATLNSAANVPFTEVDPEFLAALPPDLRMEIEQQLQQQKQVNDPDQSYRPLTPPPVANNECTNENNNNNTNNNTCISSENIFMQPKCLEKFLAWFQSADTPESCDIEIICENACELVRAKELNELYEVLLYFGRLINQQRSTSQYCAWHMAFRTVLESVQKEMSDVYEGKKLYMGVKLKCDKCKI
ncbi:DNA repair protein Rev1 [Musca vetustissima]|uniref:DNA repair protein Rev1 n=1 Tax=Musca vetustissima TaxID=27455 RepID=UPI002AB6ED9B|nr:DNA repair protein Rev1 [Musca vetustissima]